MIMIKIANEQTNNDSNGNNTTSSNTNDNDNNDNNNNSNSSNPLRRSTLHSESSRTVDFRNFIVFCWAETLPH